MRNEAHMIYACQTISDSKIVSQNFCAAYYDIKKKKKKKTARGRKSIVYWYFLKRFTALPRLAA